MCDDTEFLKMLKRMIRAGARRVGDADEVELQEFLEVRRFFDEQFARAVKAQVENGHSWQDVGDALGISKQAAFKRFSKPC